MARTRQPATEAFGKLVQKLRQQTEGADGSTPLPSAIPGVRLLRSNHANQPNLCLFRPALYMTFQGAKWATFGEKRYKFGAGQGLVVAVDVPSRGTVLQASPKEPYLGLEIELNFGIMQEVAEQLGLPSAKPAKPNAPGAFVLELDLQLVHCAQLILRLLETPEAAFILYPGIMREVCYWLLVGPRGDQMREIMIMAVGHDQRIMHSVQSLRDKLPQAIHVNDLALAANMSPATFHRQFKAVTGMTPVQYQKQLRLHEARRLLIFNGATVEIAALSVGYASVSQFSREYSRTFGTSPRRDVSTWKRSQRNTH